MCRPGRGHLTATGEVFVSRSDARRFAQFPGNSIRTFMSVSSHRFLTRTPGQKSILFIRIPVGLIFFTQGILKYTDPAMGVLRFAKIGFAHPSFTAHFVGAFEIICGLLVLFGLFTRIAAIPLLITICTAIATTKIPELFRSNQGFWYMVSDSRTDFAMLCCLLFLIVSGAGALSLDSKRVPKER